MSRTRSLVVALSAASAALVGACAAPPTPPGPAPGPPPELVQYYDQQVTFGPCAPYATTAADAQLFANERLDCTRVQVPLDYADPDGPRGAVALLRVKASGERIGSLLVNPGGPGYPAMGYVALLGSFWDSGSLRGRFDIIGFDPRGVGASTPRLDCYTDAEYDTGQVVGAGEVVPGVPDERSARELAQRCAERSGGAPALTSVGTSDVVRDMDVLRAVLGDEELSYFGASYGTELGAMYAEAFPQNLRAMALDGAIDPELDSAERLLASYTGYQQAFTALATQCAAGPDCPLGPDPARAVEAFHAVVRPLQDRPATTTDGRGLTHADALTGVLTGLRTGSQWPTVVQGLAEVAAGRGDVLLGLRDSIYGRGADGRYALDGDAFTGISCMDRPRRTPAEQTALARRVVEVNPLLDTGRPVAERHDECAAWPAPPSRPEPWLTGDVDVPAVLVVSVTGDPVTPHQGGITLARYLGGSLLTVDGDQHGSALIGKSECVDRAVADYLIDLRTPPADARCIL